ncbi:MAG: hypothetical protein AB1384_08435 [Actinomycetota bacterium]
MISKKERLEGFDADLLRREKVDHKKNLAIMDAMWKEAVTLKAFPPADPLEGIDIDIRIAKVINSV